MIIPKFFFLLLLAFWVAVIPNLISAQPPPVPSSPVTLPGSDCTSATCGNIRIPYPFSTTPDCSRDNQYLVTCNDILSPPALFLFNSTTEILEINLTGQLRVMNDVANRCYSRGKFSSLNLSKLELRPNMAVNNTANMFTVVGCDSSGYMAGRKFDGRYYSTGCISTCRNLEDTKDESCDGTGCCQITNIPTNIEYMDSIPGTFTNFNSVGTFSNCSFAFIVERGYFTFHRENLTNLRTVERLPVLIDWAIDNNETTCLNATNYACRSNYSECYLPNNGTDDDYNYRCRCNPGFQGNPYLKGEGGCQDIDECGTSGLNNCQFRCDNHPGGFSCQCPDRYDLVDGNCTCQQGYYLADGGVREGGCIRIRGGDAYKPIAGVAVGIVLVIFVVFWVYFELKRRRLKEMKQMYFLRNGGKLLEEKLTAIGNMMSINTENGTRSNNYAAKIFSSNELNHATKNFHNERIVGQGGFGTVYKGFLSDSRIVAVKKSKEVDLVQTNQFINEVVVLSQVNHRNIVKLLGCCLETQAPLLVYEFISNGTLYDHIHDNSRKRFLDWNMRLKIATETADVLSYLHSAVSIPIIHRDVKSANILLDQNFEAKVADFGASRLVPIDQTQLSTVVQGTFGYLDPEYMQTNQLTEKSDVYSFGVVLLELLTGRKPLSYDKPEDERNLTSFFLCKLQQGRLLEVFDENIVSDIGNLEQLTEVSNLARVCLNFRGYDRPTMKHVAMELEGLRSGGKQTCTKFENTHVVEKQPSYNHILNHYENDGGFSTSIGTNMRDPTKLKGGR